MLCRVVGQLEASIEDEQQAVSAHQKEESAVKGTAECLQKLEKIESERLEALEVCQHAKREGIKKLDFLFLHSEAEMRQQWVSLLQLEMDHYSMQTLCQRVDALLSEEERCRVALQHELEITSTAIAHSITQLSETNK